MLPGGYNEAAALKKVATIYDNLKQVFEIAKADKVTTHDAASRLAEQRIEAAKRARLATKA